MDIARRMLYVSRKVSVDPITAGTMSFLRQIRENPAMARLQTTPAGMKWVRKVFKDLGQPSEDAEPLPLGPWATGMISEAIVLAISLPMIRWTATIPSGIGSWMASFQKPLPVLVGAVPGRRGVVALAILAILAILVALAFQVMAFMVRRGLRSRHRSFELGRR